MNDRASRRHFLASGLAATLPFALPATSARASEPVGRTRPSHLKLSIAAYSFRDFLTGDNPRLDLFSFADLAADMAVDAIEPTTYYVPKNADAAFAHRLRRHAFLLGLDISGTAIGNDFCVPEGAAQDQEIEETRRWIDFASALNAPVIRVFAGQVPKGDTEDAAVARFFSAMTKVLPYAESKGIILALENHGGITASREQLLRLVKGIDHPNFGVNLDTANFRTADPYGDLAALAPYAVNVQVKTEITLGGKKVDADLSKLVQILRDAKYSGYVVLEYEAAADPFEAIPGHIRRLREIIS